MKQCYVVYIHTTCAHKERMMNMEIKWSSMEVAYHHVVEEPFCIYIKRLCTPMKLYQLLVFLYLCKDVDLREPFPQGLQHAGVACCVITRCHFHSHLLRLQDAPGLAAEQAGADNDICGEILCCWAVTSDKTAQTLHSDRR